ncbi:acetyl-CoA carboxylase biotin carboxyl carrier protein [bacterium]|jgi:acetyl-CoA carboxylase biotin carboxyl carrier protein|nr:acetyl-CoA carboxylase biotin carboxyl carrier protein [bacterium]
MDNQADSAAAWFDMGRIKQLVRLMKDNDLSEIDLEWETSRIKLRRGTTVVASAPPMAYAPAPVAAPAPSSGEGQAGKSAASSNLLEIKSPMVGTYYSASSPDADPFVRIGSRVAPDTAVCIIEAMKVFNEIQSGVAGVIREIAVENGAPLEYGQVIFRVDPNG